MLIVARPARQAEISASVSDLSGPTSTNAAEPQTMPATPAAAASRQPQRAMLCRDRSARRYAHEQPQHGRLHQQRGAAPRDDVGGARVRPGDDGDQCRHQQRRAGYGQRIAVQHLDALLLNASQQCGIHVSARFQRAA